MHDEVLGILYSTNRTEPPTPFVGKIKGQKETHVAGHLYLSTTKPSQIDDSLLTALLRSTFLPSFSDGERALAESSDEIGEG
jgi:hypothetical protein